MQTHVTFSADDIRSILSGAAEAKTGQKFNSALPNADGSITLTYEPAHGSQATAPRAGWWRRHFGPRSWQDAVIEHKTFETRVASMLNEVKS